MQIIKTDNAPKACWAYSQAIKTWNLIFCAGQIWLDPLTDKLVEWWTKNEALQVMKNISEVLKEADLHISDVVKTTIFLADIGDWAIVNEVYWEYFSHKPARSTVAVSWLPAWAKVEIEVIAEIT